MAVNERVAIRDGSYRADLTDPIAPGCCRLKVRETLTLTLSPPLALSRARRQEVVAMVITLHVYVACGGRIPHREARVLTNHQNLVAPSAPRAKLTMAFPSVTLFDTFAKTVLTLPAAPL